MTRKKTPAIQIPSAKAEDQPANRQMLSLVRDELKSDIYALDLKMDAGFSNVRSEIRGIHSEIHGVRSEVNGLRSDIQKIEAGYSRMHLLLEEQNSNNRIVLEGLQALWQRQERIEKQLPNS